MSDQQTDEAIRVFREYFEPTGIFENEIYEGIPAMLEHLVQAGRSLILATSKPVDFAERILEYFDIKDYFDFIAEAPWMREGPIRGYHRLRFGGVSAH